MSDDTPYMVVRDFEKPRDGWRYTVPETGYTVEGEFFKDLFDNVRRHCEANGLPQPYREDIEDAACRETNPGPSKCRKRPPKPVAGMLPILNLTMAERFLKTVWNALKERRFVSKEEAERRYAICMGCPLVGDVGGCIGCHSFLRTLTKALPRAPLPDDPQKRFCLACGCVVSAKALLPNSVLDRAEQVRPKYHSSCWRLEENRPEGDD